MHFTGLVLRIMWGLFFIDHAVIKPKSNEANMYYSSRKDLVYKIVIWSLPIFFLPFVFIIFSMAMIVVFVFSLGFSFWLWNSTSYKIENGELYIKCWILRKKVNVQNILKVRKTNNILSSYALSAERLEITENTQSIFYISPNDFDSFIEELKKYNSSIEIV